jgi:hypothetical protein
MVQCVSSVFQIYQVKTYGRQWTFPTGCCQQSVSVYAIHPVHPSARASVDLSPLYMTKYTRLYTPKHTSVHHSPFTCCIPLYAPFTLYTRKYPPSYATQSSPLYTPFSLLLSANLLEYLITLCHSYLMIKCFTY